MPEPIATLSMCERCGRVTERIRHRNHDNKLCSGHVRDVPVSPTADLEALQRRLDTVTKEADRWHEAWRSRGRRINGVGEFHDDGPMQLVSERVERVAEAQRERDDAREARDSADRGRAEAREALRDIELRGKAAVAKGEHAVLLQAAHIMAETAKRALKGVEGSSRATTPCIEPYRYEAICWNDDCSGTLDTYGRTAEVLEFAQEHANEYGHAISVEVKGTIEVTPQDDAHVG